MLQMVQLDVMQDNKMCHRQVSSFAVVFCCVRSRLCHCLVKK